MGLAADRAALTGRWRTPLLCRATCALTLAALPAVHSAMAAEEIGRLRPSEALLRSLRCDGSRQVPGWESLEASGAEIGRIHIQVGNIFDPERPSENRWAFRTVNRLHPVTRQWVVEEALLFGTGDALEHRVVEETERRLRSLSFLYDAVILPVCASGGRVDLLVMTQDVWTLAVKASFKREGGANTIQGGLSDDSFLGTGRPVSLLYVSDPDRDAYQLRFYDPSLFGRHREFRLKVEQRSDGHRFTLDLGQPFYSLDTRRALTSRWVSDRRTERLFSGGEVAEEFDHSNRLAEIRLGVSGGYRDGRSRRWSFGYAYQDDQFDTLMETPVTALPDRRTLSYPWVELEWLEDGFVEIQNLDRIGRTEDVNLGTHAGLRLGVSLPAFGGDESRAIVRSWIAAGWQPGARQMLLLRSGVDGRWGDGGGQNLLASLGLFYYWRNVVPHRLYASLRLDAGWHLDGERQLLLGGDTGVRGYLRNTQDGDRRAVFNLEQRFYSGWEVGGVVNVGAAVFFDAGAAWYAVEPESRRLLTNVGVGLRLGSSRSAQGAMVHLDVAYPLNGDVNGVQFLIRSRETF